MSHFVTTTWQGTTIFDSTIGNQTVRIDANSDPENKQGPNPKPLMLSSLAGCTGIDVVTLLKKMRVDIKTLRMDIEGELTDTVPKIYSLIRLKYYFTGEDLKVEKIIKAVKMSKEQYCGVSAMLAMVCPIEFSVYVNEELVYDKSTQADTEAKVTNT
ncbi:MAG: OsmC family protein [Bacteroidota bacterium]